MHTADTAAEVFSLIDSLEDAKDVDQIMGNITRFATPYGVEHFIFTRIPNRYQNFRDMIYARLWPEQWYYLYEKERFIFDDAVANHCLTTNDPFHWKDCPSSKGRAKAIMNLARDHGLKEGWSVPLHGIDRTGCASFAGTSLKLTRAATRGLHLLTMYAAERLRVLDEAQKVRSAHLTGREKDVLLLTAWGKTALEMGEILGLTPRTIGHHVRSATEKLGANSKAQAVVIAMQRRYICP